MNIFTFFCLSFLILNGVFSVDPDEVKSESVTERDSLTLQTDVIKQKDDVILWCYGADNSLVAKTNGKVGSTKYYDGDDGRFRNRVKLDDQTGDLIITNMRTEDSGLYTLKISNKKISYKRFNVTVNGVFADPDEVKSVSVTEGDSVTLHTDVNKHTDDVILWCYGPENSLVAKTNGKVGSTKYYDGEDGKLIGRLMLDAQTGSLTITNMKSEESGLYTLKISNKKISYKKFNVTVYARLPVPVIYSSQHSSSERPSCMFLCSVMNVSHDVSVSWYKGKSLLSSISVSDQKNIFLPLEVEYQDTNTYRCMVNNPITNLTQHLHITQHTSSDSPGMRVITIAVVFTLLLCVILIIVGVYKHKKAHLINTSHSKVPLTDEERSITSEDTEASGFQNELGIVKVPL